MAYLGKDVVGIMSYSRAKDTMTGDGSTTTLTLSRDPGTQNNVEIYMDGVLQTPGVEYTLAGKVITFTTAPETGLNVVALSGTETEIMEPADNSVVASHLVGGLSLTDAKIAGLSSSKLSGALPALDGSALTNMSGGINVKSASDPATDTNHANGVGATWVNTTSGEMFVCTDATTDANVWTNVGSGSGNVAPYYNSAGGTVAGFAVGGYAEPASTGTLTAIDKYAFASGSSDAVDHGDLASRRSSNAGTWSATHGYSSGGYVGSSLPKNQTVDKFAFAGTNVTSTNIGNLSSANMMAAGCSSETSGYHCGCYHGSGSFDNGIDRINFGSDSVSHDVGSLNSHANVEQLQGNHSTTHGYIVGGDSSDKIDSFSFASEGQTSLVGTLTMTRSGHASQNTEMYGYSAGGQTWTGGWATIGAIEKFSFGSSVTSTARSNDLTVVQRNNRGFTSTSHGYSYGGLSSGSGEDRIEKFSTASDTATEDISNLSFGKNTGSSAQN